VTYLSNFISFLSLCSSSY